MSSRSSERAFIRHPVEVPIEIRSVPGAAASRVADVSFGGLSFTSEHPLDPATSIEIRIPVVDAGFRARACVVWCRPAAHGFRIGVRFLDARDAFHTRMIEQLCAIESYRRSVRERDGRSLTGEQAAREWIERFGEEFPRP